MYIIHPGGVAPPNGAAGVAPPNGAATLYKPKGASPRKNTEVASRRTSPAKRNELILTAEL